MMAESSRHERLQPSLLDRLTDNARDSHRESFDSQTLSMQQLREAVLRDLSWLLNTTNIEAIADLDATPSVAASTLNYGIPNFTGLAASTRRAAALETAIATAIRTFEPRISPASLRVRARDEVGDNGLPSLIFDIQGELWAQPVPQQLFLETSIDLKTRLAVVVDSKARR
jgi:type VI secretion system protein ImpF